MFPFKSVQLTYHHETKQILLLLFKNFLLLKTPVSTSTDLFVHNMKNKRILLHSSLVRL